jgi:hypothetical protein
MSDTGETRETRDVTTRDLAARESDARAEDAAPESGPKQAGEPTAVALLPPEEGDRYRSDWQEIQTAFVDEPRSSVESADKLVADLMQQLATSFSDERARLEGQWDRGDDVSTEDLRVALTKYRSFFERLLAA